MVKLDRNQDINDDIAIFEQLNELNTEAIKLQEQSEPFY